MQINGRGNGHRFDDETGRFVGGLHSPANGRHRSQGPDSKGEGRGKDRYGIRLLIFVIFIGLYVDFSRIPKEQS